MGAPSQAGKPTKFLLGIVSVMTRHGSVRCGKSRPVVLERRAGALKMRRHANQVNANPRWAGPDMGMSDAVAQIPNW